MSPTWWWYEKFNFPKKTYCQKWPIWGQIHQCENFYQLVPYQICEWFVLTKEMSSSIIERTVGNFLNCFGKRYRLSAFKCRVGCPSTTSSSVFTLSYTSLINHHLEGTFKGKTVGTVQTCLDRDVFFFSRNSLRKIFFGKDFLDKKTSPKTRFFKFLCYA